MGSMRPFFGWGAEAGCGLTGAVGGGLVFGKGAGGGGLPFSVALTQAMMKMKWMWVPLLAVMFFSPRVAAMSLEDLERGSGAAVKFLDGGVELNDDERLAAQNFERYVLNFYRWILLIGIYSADSETEAQRVVKLVPTEGMQDAKYYSVGIDRFIKAHKPAGMETERVEAEGVLLSWYLSQHPESKFWQKVMIAASMKKTFGPKYPGIEVVEKDLEAAREAEGKGGPKPGGVEKDGKK